MLCEGCDCVGGEFDDLGRSWEIYVRIETRKFLKRRAMRHISMLIRFRLSRFCLVIAGTGVTGGDSRSMVCEGCDCAGGEFDGLDRSWEIYVGIERRKFLKRRAMSMLICI